MRSQAVWTAILAIALVGCKKDGGGEAKPDDVVDKGRGSAAPDEPPPIVQLAAATIANTQAVTSAAVVVIKADGSLAVGETPAYGAMSGLDLAAVKAEPVADLPTLVTRVATIALAAEAASQPDAGVAAAPDAGTAKGQYKMKTSDSDPALARAEALEAAKTAGILGSAALETDPCEQFGFGKSGFGEGGGAPTIGTIGVGSGYGVGAGGGVRSTPAGLRGATLQDAWCARSEPLVLVDATAPAARLIEVLSAFDASRIAVSVDGGAHAHALPIQFKFTEGNQPGSALEIGIQLTATGASASMMRGAKPADGETWTWSGAVDQLDAAVKQALEQPERAWTTARLRLDAGASAGQLIAALGELIDAGAHDVGLGEPVVFRRMRTDDVPTVELGKPTLEGDGLDEKVVRRYIKRNLPKLKYCYEKQLLVTPGLEGTVTAGWTIQANGLVTGATADGVSPEVASCVVGMLAGIEYPKPTTGTVKVTSYTFTYAPKGG